MRARLRVIISLFSLFIAPFVYAQTPLASIIKIPNKEPTEVAYKDLVCTEQDKAAIFEIVTTMSENGKIALLLKQNHLRFLGAQINHIHPLKFLSTVFANPRLKVCMFDIFDDYFKRNGMMEGLGPSLSKEAEKGKLMQYLNEFAAEVNVSPDDLRGFFQSRDWEGMVRYLIES